MQQDACDTSTPLRLSLQKETDHFLLIALIVLCFSLIGPALSSLNQSWHAGVIISCGNWLRLKSHDHSGGGEGPPWTMNWEWRNEEHSLEKFELLLWRQTISRHFTSFFSLFFLSSQSFYCACTYSPWLQRVTELQVSFSWNGAHGQFIWVSDNAWTSPQCRIHPWRLDPVVCVFNRFPKWFLETLKFENHWNT